MATLSYKNDDGMECSVEVSAEQPLVKIGRAKDCVIRTSNGTVSRRHCQVMWDDGVYSISDLGSSNGTFYRRERIHQQVLESGDAFFCGNFRVTFLISEVGETPTSGAEGTAAAWADEPAESTSPTLTESPDLLREQVEVARAERRIAVQDAHAANQQLAELRVQLESLEGELTFAREGAERMKAEAESAGAEACAALESELSDLRVRLQIVEDERDTLVTEREHMSAGHVDAGERIASQARRIEELNSELTLARESNAEHQARAASEHAEAVETINSLRTSTDALETSVAALSKELEAAQRALSDSEATHHTDAEVLKSLQAELEAALHSADLLETQKTLLDEEVAALKLELEVAPEPGQVAKLEDALAARDAIEVGLRAEQGRLSAELSEQSTTIRTLSESLDEARKATAEREHHTRRIEVEIEELKALLMDSATSEEVAALKDESETRQQAIMALEAQRQLDKEAFEGLVGELEEQGRILESIEGERDSLTAERDSLRAECTSILEKLHASDVAAKEAHAVLNELRSQSGQAERDMADELGRAKAHAKTAESALEAVEAKLQHAEARIDAEADTRSALQAQLEERAEAFDELEKRSEALQDKLVVSEAALGAARAELAVAEGRAQDAASEAEVLSVRLSDGVASSESERSALESRLVESEAAMTSLRAELEAAESRAQAAQLEVEALSARLSDDAASFESERSVLESRLAESEVSTTSLRAELEAAEGRAQAAQLEVEALWIRANEAPGGGASATAEAEAKMKALSDVVATLERERNASRQALEQAHEANIRLERIIQANEARDDGSTDGTDGRDNATSSQEALAFREDLTSHFEDVNDLASGWRNDVSLVADYIADLDADDEDDSTRAEVMEGLRETLDALGEASREMKLKLKEVREFLDS